MPSSPSGPPRLSTTQPKPAVLGSDDLRPRRRSMAGVAREANASSALDATRGMHPPRPQTPPPTGHQAPDAARSWSLWTAQPVARAYAGHFVAPPSTQAPLLSFMPVLRQVAQALEQGDHGVRRVGLYLGGSAALSALGHLDRGQRPGDVDPLVVVEARGDTRTESIRRCVLAALHEALPLHAPGTKVRSTVLGARHAASRVPLLITMSRQNVHLDLRIVASDCTQRLYDVAGNGLLIDLLSQKAAIAAVPGVSVSSAQREAQFGVYAWPKGLKRDGVRRLWSIHQRGWVPAAGGTKHGAAAERACAEALLTDLLAHIHDDSLGTSALDIAMQQQFFINQRLLPGREGISPALLANAVAFLRPLGAAGGSRAQLLDACQSVLSRCPMADDSAAGKQLVHLLASPRGTPTAALLAFLAAERTATSHGITAEPRPWVPQAPLGAARGVTRLLVPEMGGYVVFPYAIATWLETAAALAEQTPLKDLVSMAMHHPDEAEALAFLLGHRAAASLPYVQTLSAPAMRKLAARRLTSAVGELPEGEARAAWVPRAALIALRLNGWEHYEELLAPLEPLPPTLSRLIAPHLRRHELESWRALVQAMRMGVPDGSAERVLWEEAGRRLEELPHPQRTPMWSQLLGLLEDGCLPRVDAADAVARALEVGAPRGERVFVEVGKARLGALAQVLESPLRSHERLLLALVNRADESFESVMRHLSTQPAQAVGLLSELVGLRFAYLRTIAAATSETLDRSLETLIGLLVMTAKDKPGSASYVTTIAWRCVGLGTDLFPEILTWIGQSQDEDGKCGPGQEIIAVLVNLWTSSEQVVAELLACDALTLDHPLASPLCHRLAEHPNPNHWRSAARWLQKTLSGSFEEMSPQQRVLDAQRLGPLFVQAPRSLSRLLRHVPEGPQLCAWLTRITHAYGHLAPASHQAIASRLQMGIVVDGLISEIMRRQQPELCFRALAALYRAPAVSAVEPSLARRLAETLLRLTAAPVRQSATSELVAAIIDLLDTAENAKPSEPLVAAVGAWLVTLCRTSPQLAVTLLAALNGHAAWSPVLLSASCRPNVAQKETLGWLEDSILQHGERWHKAAPKWFAMICSDMQEVALREVEQLTENDSAITQKRARRALRWLRDTASFAPLALSNGHGAQLRDALAALAEVHSQMVFDTLENWLTTDAHRGPRSGTLTIWILWATALPDGPIQRERVRSLVSRIVADDFGVQVTSHERMQVAGMLLRRMLSWDLAAMQGARVEVEAPTGGWQTLLIWLAQSTDTVAWHSGVILWYKKALVERGLLPILHGSMVDDVIGASLAQIRVAKNEGDYAVAEHRLIELSVCLGELVESPETLGEALSQLKMTLAALNSLPVQIQRAFGPPLIELSQRLAAGPQAELNYLVRPLLKRIGAGEKRPAAKQGTTSIDQRLEAGRLSALGSAFFCDDDESFKIVVARLISKQSGLSPDHLTSPEARQLRHFLMTFFLSSQQRRLLGAHWARMHEIFDQSAQITLTGRSSTRSFQAYTQAGIAALTLGTSGYAFCGPYQTADAWPLLMGALLEANPGMLDLFELFVAESLRLPPDSANLPTFHAMWARVVASMATTRALGLPTASTTWAKTRIDDCRELLQASMLRAPASGAKEGLKQRQERAHQIWLDVLAAYVTRADTEMVGLGSA